MLNAKVIATAYVGDAAILCVHGMCEWTVETTDDLPADALGEAVSLATERAWKSGHDPAGTPGFHIRVRFERIA